MYKVLKIIANIYLVLFFIFWLFCMFGVFIKSGFAGVQKILSPFNTINMIVTIISLSPALILMAIADKVKQKEKT